MAPERDTKNSVPIIKFRLAKSGAFYVQHLVYAFNRTAMTLVYGTNMVLINR